MIGTRLGHYVIVEQLGRGGMGDVYVAEDTKLARRVALKVPRQAAGESLDHRVRLQREAKAAASLNHPNIVHLYSVEESDGVLFITMELVQGRSLRDIVGSGAPLHVARAVDFAAQMADGLACAHAAGVLHRDLKPGNVVITEDDRVKILDFGLAKLLTPGVDPEAITLARETTTSAGMTLGTAGYMSPEQALGKPVDQRTDLFALGAVLFEMVTGRAPFEGDTLPAVFDQLLNRRHPSPRALNPALPSRVASIIDRALEKEPERRYASANDLLQDLRRLEQPSARGYAASAIVGEARHPSSVVVLPFVDLSAAKDQEYFCHGVTDEIIGTLTSVPGLRVISRTSAFAFLGKDLEVTEICRRLRVGAALEGSVRKAGDRLRINVQLVDADEGYQLWSKRFDRELSDIFSIQDEIAATIASELRPPTTVTIDQPQMTPRTRTASGVAALRAAVDVGAHDAYLKGMYALNKWTEESMGRAIVHFRQAIDLDPGFAPAYAALAEGYVWLYSGLGILPARETVPQARSAIEQALALDPTLASAHKVRGLIAMNHDWDRGGAAEGLTRAIELGPGSAAAHLWNGWRLALLERQHEQALLELDEAERLDPLDLQIKTQIGYVHLFHREADRAIEQFERVLSLEPSFGFAHYALGDAYTQKRQYERALAKFEKAIELGGRSVNHVGVLGYVHGLSGNHDQARALLDELLSRVSRGYVSAIWIALIHLGLSDLDGLFQWLERAFEERDGSLILVTAAVEFDPVRGDPRFKALLERMDLGHLAASTM